MAVTSIENRFEQFMKTLPSVELIDDLDLGGLSGSKKADYFGLGRNVVFEQKCITQDQAQKIQGFMDEHEKEDWYPMFFGGMDINKILDHAPNKEEIQKKIISKTTQLIEYYFKNSNSQISATKMIFNIPDSIGILVILNDSVSVLSPEILSHRIQARLKQTREDFSRRFNEVNLVILITETHQYKNRASSVLRIDGPSPVPRKVEEYLNYLVLAWGQFNGSGVEYVHPDNFSWDEFVQKEEIQKSPLKRHEARTIWYQQNPYMRGWTDEEVMKFGAKVFEETAPAMIKGGIKVPVEVLGEQTLVFGDFIAEANFRGFDMKNFGKHINRENISKFVDLKSDE